MSPSRAVGVQYTKQEEQRAIINSWRNNEVTGPKCKGHSAVSVIVKVKFDAIKNNIA